MGNITVYHNITCFNEVKNVTCQTTFSKPFLVQQIKTCWRSLCDSFARELKLQREESRSGAGSSKRTVYTNFQALMFRRPVLQLRQTETSLDEVAFIVHEDDQESTEDVDDNRSQDGSTQDSRALSEETLVENVDPEISLSASSTSSTVDGQSTSVPTLSISSASSTANKGRGCQQVTRTQFGLLQQQTHQLTSTLENLVGQNGPYYHFGLGVAKMLENLPSDRVPEIQHQINTAIYEGIAKYQRELRSHGAPPPSPERNLGYQIPTVTQHPNAWRAPPHLIPPPPAPQHNAPQHNAPQHSAPQHRAYHYCMAAPVRLTPSISYQEDEEEQNSFFKL